VNKILLILLLIGVIFMSGCAPCPPDKYSASAGNEYIALTRMVINTGRFTIPKLI